MIGEQLMLQQTIALDELRLLYSRMQSARERLLNKLYTVLAIISLAFTVAAALGALPAGGWALVAAFPSLIAVVLVLNRMWTLKGYEVPLTSNWDTLVTRHIEVSLDDAFKQIASNYCAAIDAEETANQKLGRTVNGALIALLLQLLISAGLCAVG